MAVIRDRHYDDAVTKLANDPIVINMALAMQSTPREQMSDSSGGPSFDFMNAANREYNSRGGTFHAHIGAVAEAIFKILDFLETPGAKWEIH